MRTISVIDSETDPFVHGRIPEPFIWGFYDGKEQLYFEQTSELVNFISKRKEYIYAHNGGKFDFHYLLSFINVSNVLVINGRIVQVRIGEAILRDSYAILPIPLAAYKKDEIDYAKFEKSIRHLYMDEIKSYLHGDCAYLYQLVKSFYAEFGNKVTLASAGFSKAKAICGIKNFSTTNYFYQIFKPWYHGGRVSIFQKGIIKGKSYIYDINSAYPYAMIQSHPFGSEVLFHKESSVPDLHNIDKLSFYEVSGTAKGSLPYMNKKTLQYPTDDNERTYYVTGYELYAALETNSFEGIIKKRITFKHRINFYQYINHYYEQKKRHSKHESEYILAKLAMNSVYGKLAANPDNYMDYVICKPELAKELCEQGKYIPVYLPKQFAILSRPILESRKRFYNVATAASITGYVRAMLWKTIQQVRDAGYDVYYCDTDSIITNCPSMPTGIELGQWKLEQTNNLLYMFAPKVYAARSTDGVWKTASKGVNLTPDEIKELVSDSRSVTWHNAAPTFSIKKPVAFISRKLLGLNCSRDNGGKQDGSKGNVNRRRMGKSHMVIEDAVQEL